MIFEKSKCNKSLSTCQNIYLKGYFAPGSPAPQLNWWREHALIDGSYDHSDGQKTVNTILIENLQRTDLHSILTCQASNNNISNPVSSSVKIDMHCRILSASPSFVSDPVSFQSDHSALPCWTARTLCLLAGDTRLSAKLLGRDLRLP